MGQYVKSVCTTTSDSIVSNCTNPVDKEYVLHVCVPGGIHSMGSDTYLGSCTSFFEGMIMVKNCTKGSFNTIGSNAVLYTCKEGSYCINNKEYPCPKGFYCPSKVSAPIKCDKGKFDEISNKFMYYYCGLNSVSPSYCRASFYCPSTYEQFPCPLGKNHLKLLLLLLLF